MHRTQPQVGYFARFHGTRTTATAPAPRRSSHSSESRTCPSMRADFRLCPNVCHLHTNRPHRFPCGVLSLSPRYVWPSQCSMALYEYDHVGHKFICTNTQPPTFSPTNNSSSPMNNNKAPGRTTFPVPVSLAPTFFWAAITRCFMICMSRRRLFFSSSLVFFPAAFLTSDVAVSN